MMKDKIEAIEKAIAQLEELYTPSTEAYMMKRQLLQQYRKEWHALKQAINKPLK